MVSHAHNPTLFPRVYLTSICRYIYGTRSNILARLLASLRALHLSCLAAELLTLGTEPHNDE